MRTAYKVGKAFANTLLTGGCYPQVLVTSACLWLLSLQQLPHSALPCAVLPSLFKMQQGSTMTTVQLPPAAYALRVPDVFVSTKSPAADVLPK